MANTENNIADAISELANAVETVAQIMDTRSDFNGFTIADSLGIIADAMFKIAEAKEKEINIKLQDR